MTQSFESLRDLLSRSGYEFVEPPIIYDADVFVELAGEDLRRRLFLTNLPDGGELALRPDYTIPVCRAHLAGGSAKRRADYAYLGPVFRQRPGENGEFLQAGIESLGRTDRAAADADVLALALAAVDLLGIQRPVVKIGDQALFVAALDALQLDGPWRQRLARSFGEPKRLSALIAKAANGSDAIPDMDRRAAGRKAQQLLLATGLGTIGSRTAKEIADRVVEKSALAVGIGARAHRVLKRFLAIEGTPAHALKSLRDLARRESLDITTALNRFEKRMDAFSKRGVEVEKLTLAADFGRRLDYYTGFVFEIHDSQRSDGRQIVGGGRYDRLVAMIGDGQSLPAVGFAIWLDRIGAKQ